MPPKRKFNEMEATPAEGAPSNASTSATSADVAGKARTASLKSKKTANIVKVTKDPKTIIDKVISVIRFLKAPGGSSAQSIIKGCDNQYGLLNVAAIRKVLKVGTEKGIFLKNKASFLVTGDPLYEDTSEKVEIEDVKIGATSAQQAVDRGFECTIAYVGTLANNGYKFDAGKSFTFTVGAGDVIKGMDAGVIGMLVGGHRVVTIPSSLGYGKRGSLPDIPPDATLRFDIKLKAANPP